MESIEHNGKTITFDTVREWDLKVIEANIPINGCSCQWNEFGEYRIFINRELSDREKLEVFVHEMIHIYNGDHDNKDMNIQEIEERTHELTEEIIKKLEY